MLNVIAVVVLVVWAANFLASLLVPDYDGAAINGVFTVIMGAILAIKGKQSVASGDDNDSTEGGEK